MPIAWKKGFRRIAWVFSATLTIAWLALLVVYFINLSPQPNSSAVLRHELRVPSLVKAAASTTSSEYAVWRHHYCKSSQEILKNLGLPANELMSNLAVRGYVYDSHDFLKDSDKNGWTRSIPADVQSLGFEVPRAQLQENGHFPTEDGFYSRFFAIGVAAAVLLGALTLCFLHLAIALVSWIVRGFKR